MLFRAHRQRRRTSRRPWCVHDATRTCQAVEKLIVSKLLVEGSNRRIYNVDHHVGMVRGTREAGTPGMSAAKAVASSGAGYQLPQSARTCGEESRG